MENLVIAAQIVIALGLVNVWVLRFSRATAYRGGRAQNLREEFAAYGLPSWSLFAIGGLKLSIAALLVAAVWFAGLRQPASAALALLMLGAVLMHVRVRDPLVRSVPALGMLALSMFVALGAS